MSKKIKQDYEEQKRQAAETNAINQLETFHAESMTMEAHKSRIERFVRITFEMCLPGSVGKILGEIHRLDSFQKLGNDQVEILIDMYHRDVETHRPDLSQ
jgi:hypothetical protein